MNMHRGERFPGRLPL